MSDVLDLPPLQGGDGVPLSDLAAPTSKPEETPAPSAPQQFAPLPETIAAPNQIPVVATKVVAMIVPADVKADRKIEFVVDGVKYSAVLPEGLKAGDTFRARIPATPIMLPVVGPAAGESAPKRPKAEESMQQGAKKPKFAKKKREVKSDEEEEEEDESKGQDEMESPFDRLAADEIHQILTLTGMTGLCVVLPRVSKEMKAHAAAALSSMEHIDISPYESVSHPSRPDHFTPDHFTNWSAVERRCVPASQIPFLTFDEDNLWATSPWPFSEDAIEAAAKMTTFVDNFKLVLSKTTALKSLFLEATFYFLTDDCEHETVPLPAFSLATVASTLRTLSVRVKPSSQTLLDIVSSCPGLEELSWRLLGGHEKHECEYSHLVLDESMVAALKHAKTACPNLTKLPMLEVCLYGSHRGLTWRNGRLRPVECNHRLEDVRAFFALLRSWPNLEYAAIDLVYSEKVITEAKAFAGAPGDFKGILYILVMDIDNKDFAQNKFTQDEDGRNFIDLVNEPQLKVRVEPMYI